MSDDVYNPKDRFKNHLKRKSSSRRIEPSQKPSSAAVVAFSENEIENCSTPSTSNPFRISSPEKKRRKSQSGINLEEEDRHTQIGFALTKLQDEASDAKLPIESAEDFSCAVPEKKCSNKKQTTNEPQQKFDTKMVKDFHAIDFSELLSTTSAAGVLNNEQEKERSLEFPLDLRVGSKLRVVSKTPFPWMSSRKTTGIVSVRIPASERYYGLKFFNEVFQSGSENASINEPPTPLSILEASTMFWQFPVVPGLPLYPRINTELKVGNRIPLAPLSITTMSDQWVECFEQLFMSYKKGQRESFYVASAVFNVLFTKSHESDDVEIEEESQSCFGATGQKLVALVSHTTSSTREHIRNQGVEYEVIGDKTMKRSLSSSGLLQSSRTFDGFEMNENSLSCNYSMPPREKEYKDDSSDENDSPTKANQQWLKDIGVSPKRIKGTSKRKLSSFLTNREGVSCLLIKGSSVQSLYNMLMSSDVVHEKSGPYTKIPPTLIASSPFLYGQLLSLSKSSQVLNKSGSKAPEYVLELDGGPILPHCAKMIVTYLRRSDLCEKTVNVHVSDRHSSNGMNEWTERAKNWNTIQVLKDYIQWNKSVC